MNYCITLTLILLSSSLVDSGKADLGRATGSVPQTIAALRNEPTRAAQTETPVAARKQQPTAAGKPQPTGTAVKNNPRPARKQQPTGTAKRKDPIRALLERIEEKLLVAAQTRKSKVPAQTQKSKVAAQTRKSEVPAQTQKSEVPAQTQKSEGHSAADSPKKPGTEEKYDKLTIEPPTDADESFSLSPQELQSAMTLFNTAQVAEKLGNVRKKGCKSTIYESNMEERMKQDAVNIAMQSFQEAKFVTDLQHDTICHTRKDLSALKKKTVRQLNLKLGGSWKCKMSEESITIIADDSCHILFSLDEVTIYMYEKNPCNSLSTPSPSLSP